MKKVFCGTIDRNFINKKVELYGWVHSRRDHGGVIFVDLRDREGIVQVVFQPENKELFSLAEKLRNEYVLKIVGTVRERPEGTVNPKIFSGEVEVVAESLEILNTSLTLPMEISEYKEVSEEVRLKYRYLDLRRNEMYRNIKLRSEVMNIIRTFFLNHGFIEVETPFLTKSTPEGARDFLVPSRLSPGEFYALPQSPQLFKQILMVAGIERYFQIVRCFRDEDLRADRQPEFTQVDFEISFCSMEDILTITEELISEIFLHITGKKLSTPFPRIDYAECISKYGTDKPDLRYRLEIQNVTRIFRNTEFKIFKESVDNNGEINVIVVPEGAKFSRQEIDGYISFIQSCGGKGLAWMKFVDGKFESNITKYFSNTELTELKESLNLKNDEIIFFSAGNKIKSCELLGFLREKIAKDLNLTNSISEYKFLWVINFPLFEYSEEEKRLVSVHHPFTAPKEKDIPLLDTSPLDVHSYGYDLVVNGIELGGGSIRIHKPELQKKIFKILQLTDEEVEERFKFLLESLSYGAPPHGGLAMGLDRLLSLLVGGDTIRDVIPFPKTQKGVCMLTGAPSNVNRKQLDELGISLKISK